MSIVLLFYRITREINPVSANFRNLEEQQFLLGAIGDLNGKKISDTLIRKFKVSIYEFILTCLAVFFLLQKGTKISGHNNVILQPFYQLENCY